AGRRAGGVLVLLGERLQGSDRLHPGHSGADLAVAHRQPPRGGGIVPEGSQASLAAARETRPRGAGGIAGPRVALAVVVALLIVAPWVLPRFYVTLLNYVGLYSLVALGVGLLTGVAGQISFGQAAFVGVGAYTTAVLTVQSGLSPWVTLPIALAVAGVVAWLIGLITLRM